jgi:hypothetical protein
MNLKSIARDVSIGLTVLTILSTGLATSASAGTFCADGTYSYSTGKGTCSWHGGILGGAPSKQNGYGSTNKSYGSSLNEPYGLNSYGSTKKSYGSSLNDPYGLNSYGSTKKSYGSSLNDPYGLNSYGSFGTKKCYSLIC